MGDGPQKTARRLTLDKGAIPPNADEERLGLNTFDTITIITIMIERFDCMQAMHHVLLAGMGSQFLSRQSIGA